MQLHPDAHHRAAMFFCCLHSCSMIANQVCSGVCIFFVLKCSRFFTFTILTVNWKTCSEANKRQSKNFMMVVDFFAVCPLFAESSSRCSWQFVLNKQNNVIVRPVPHGQHHKAPRQNFQDKWTVEIRIKTNLKLKIYLLTICWYNCARAAIYKIIALLHLRHPARKDTTQQCESLSNKYFPKLLHLHCIWKENVSSRVWNCSNLPLGVCCFRFTAGSGCQ